MIIALTLICSSVSNITPPEATEAEWHDKHLLANMGFTLANRTGVAERDGTGVTEPGERLGLGVKDFLGVGGEIWPGFVL